MEILLSGEQVAMLNLIMADRRRFLGQSDRTLEELARMIATAAGAPAGAYVFYQAEPNGPVVLKPIEEESK